MKFLFPDRPTIMGILNVTPDSFSDGGKYYRQDAALARACELIEQGADIVDIGGESTRPGAESVSVSEELDRVVPVVESIRREMDVCISIDTSTPEVMAEAATIGIDLINDVRALSRSGALGVAAEAQVGVCLMHMQGEPGTMQLDPNYQDVIAEIDTFLQQRLEACVEAGIKREHIILDPGFGFGKTPEQNLRLVNELERFSHFECPLLVGLSRKSTIRKLLGDTPEALLTGSIAGAIWAYQKGAQILRVHDVAETKWALTMASALAGASSH
jgi:dihydropteroate synthase